MMQFEGRFAAMAFHMGDKAGEPRGPIQYDPNGNASQPSTTGTFYYDRNRDEGYFVPASHRMGANGQLEQMYSPFEE